jgi:hypothetical protein
MADAAGAVRAHIGELLWTIDVLKEARCQRPRRKTAKTNSQANGKTFFPKVTKFRFAAHQKLAANEPDLRGAVVEKSSVSKGGQVIFLSGETVCAEGAVFADAVMDL